MEVKIIEGKKVLDVRGLPPYQRHELIFKVFEELKPAKEMLVVNDHEPVHLFHHLIRENMSTSFDKEREYNNDEFNPVPIYSTNDYRVLLTFIKAGQFIPVHRPNIDLIFLVKSGKGKFVVGDEKFQIKAGDILVVPKGTTKRGIYAEEDIEALHIVITPPSSADHHEVAKKLKKKIFE